MSQKRTFLTFVIMIHFLKLEVKNMNILEKGHHVGCFKCNQ